MDLLKHFGIHFSQLHPLAFMWVVHFELSCVAVSGEPSVPLFCMFYELQSDGTGSPFPNGKTVLLCLVIRSCQHPLTLRSGRIGLFSFRLP
ncbi:hypothetical protein Hanom_Chr07g00605471 [Helianthus anomalus]